MNGGGFYSYYLNYIPHFCELLAQDLVNDLTL
jgi:hypothetical protein